MTMTGNERPVVPPTEVRPKAKRRTFSAEFKRRILAEADACSKPGEVGALLRREGLYSSHLTEWRRLRKQAELDALAPKKRGGELEVVLDGGPNGRRRRDELKGRCCWSPGAAARPTTPLTAPS